MTRWFDEALHDDAGLALRLRRDGSLHESRSGAQQIEIFENRLLGRVLTLDGIVQTTERDEFAYHEMLVHVPMMAHGRARDIAIIGGGDGGTLREVMRHRVRSVTLVEVDPAVVDLCKRFLPALSEGAFGDERLDLVIGDGAGFVAETDRRFDVVIVDSTDPVGPGRALFTDAFYRGCRRVLKSGGVLATQAGVAFVQGEDFAAHARAMAHSFADVSCYLTVVPSYIGGHMALGWGSDDAALRKWPLETIARRWAPLELETRYYTPEVHVASFALPPFIGDMIAGSDPPPGGKRPAPGLVDEESRNNAHGGKHDDGR